MGDKEGAQNMSNVFAMGMEEKLGSDLAKNGGGIVTGFVGLVSYTNIDGDLNWSLIGGQNQGILMTLGMVDVIIMLVDEQAQEMLGMKDNG